MAALIAILIVALRSSAPILDGTSRRSKRLNAGQAVASAFARMLGSQAR